MKMRELEQRTGVNRETIRVYLREGLLPEPARPKPNVADYGEDHVRAIQAIRQLQVERRLSLPEIRRAMAGDARAVRRNTVAYPHLDVLVAARLGVDGSLVPLARITGGDAVLEADARVLEREGAITLVDRDGVAHLGHADAQILSIWSDMRAGGFTEANGFSAAVAAFYVEAANALADREVTEFLNLLGDRVDAATAAEMARRAVDLMLSFFGVLRTKAVLAHLARRTASPAAPDDVDA